MGRKSPTKKTCPGCSQRACKCTGTKIAEKGEVNRPAGIEMTYQCDNCGHQWKVRVTKG